MARSTNREDHLKALYSLGEGRGGDDAWVSTNEMAVALGVKAPSVTNMVQVLQELGWAEHRPYRGARLTPLGRELAVGLVRKHRLWETFLVEQLGFGWEQVHDIAEQMEHIDCPELVDRLDAFLGRPKVDPHGDPIPDAAGNIEDNRELTVPLPEGFATPWWSRPSSTTATKRSLPWMRTACLLGSPCRPKPCARCRRRCATCC